MKKSNFLSSLANTKWNLIKFGLNLWDKIWKFFEKRFHKIERICETGSIGFLLGDYFYSLASNQHDSEIAITAAI